MARIRKPPPPPESDSASFAARKDSLGRKASLERKAPLGPKGRLARSGQSASDGPWDDSLVAVSGVHSVSGALAYQGSSCRELFLARRRASSSPGAEMAAKAMELGVPVACAESAFLDSLAGSEHHQGAVLLVSPKLAVGFDELVRRLPQAGPALVLALDHIEDPRNLGALVRSAAAFGALGVVVPKDRGAPLTQAARAASAGASEFLDLVRVVNLPRALKELKELGFWVVAADAEDASPLKGFEFPERCVLVLGSEGRGLGREVARQADFRVSVRLAENSPVSSLNVSNAGAIIMHAWASRS